MLCPFFLCFLDRFRFREITLIYFNAIQLNIDANHTSKNKNKSQVVKI